MARALIVGCGCRGRLLGSALIERGWQVRGTTRRSGAFAEIEAEGIEAVLADPDRVGTVIEQIEAVTVVVWLMGSATGDSAADVNGPRLERLLEKLVDSPVRGFIYEAAGSVGSEALGEGTALVAEASARWHIPARVVDVDPRPAAAWADAFASAVEEVLAG